MSVDIVAHIALAIGQLIKAVAGILGEPEEDVRKRVLAQVLQDAMDPSDETDKVSAEIDADILK